MSMLGNSPVSWQMFTHHPSDLIAPIDTDVKYIEMTVRIVPDWNVSVYLDWDAPTPPDQGENDDDVTYMIYSSDSEMGPFTSITVQPIRDTTYFTRWQVEESKVYEQFFTIECIYADGRKYRSYPQTPSFALPKWQQLRQRDIVRRESILLEKFVGVPTTIYVPRDSGLRCPDCWDPVHLKVIRDHCETCYGTSYEGGYNTGIETLMQYTSIDAQSNYSYVGTEEPITISAWTILLPLIPPHSIVLRTGDRKVFRCEGHQGSTEMMTTIQRQNIVLRELSRDSVENKLFNRTDAVKIMPRVPHVHT